MYKSNINDVIAAYGSAVPAAFLQKAVIVLVDEESLQKERQKCRSFCIIIIKKVE